MAPEVWSRMMKSASPSDYYEDLKNDEKSSITKWKEKRSVILRDRLHKEIEAELECDMSLIRESTPFIRFLVKTDNQSFPQKAATCDKEEAMLTIWNPTEDQLNELKEGASVQVLNVAVRERKYDGRIQLTANGRTRIEVLAPSSPSQTTPPMGFTKRRFQTLLRVHALSHKPKSAGSNASQPDIDIDAVAIVLTVVGDSKNGFGIHVTDESRLILRIQCDALPFCIDSCPYQSTARQNVESPYVVSFCDLRILAFDEIDNCAVAQFRGNSSVASKATSRAVRMQQWASSEGGQDQLYRVASFFDAKVPPFERRDWMTAIGYIVGLNVDSGDLHIEVDCGTSEIQQWEFPVHLLEAMISALGEIFGPVALAVDEERNATKLGILERIFRERGVIWKFQLRPKVLSACCFIVTGVELADTQALATLY
jgi:hypothetical protein